MPGEKPPQNGKKESETQPPEIPGLPPEPTPEKSKADEDRLKEHFARFIEEKEAETGRIIQRGTAPEGQEPTPSEPKPAEVDYVRAQTPQGAQLRPVGEVEVSEVQPTDRTGDATSAEKTPREAKEELRASVEEIEKAIRPSDEERRQRREHRAREFAEKFGITVEREEMLAVEKRYQDAVTEHQSKNIRLPWKGVSKDLQEEYDTARVKWREALTNAAEKSGTERERVKAVAISFQDTVMRAEEARIAARQQGLEERAKTAFGKTLGWARAGALAIPKGYLKGTEKAGTWLARNSEGEVGYDEKVKKYVRATRILSSAALGTALFGGFGVAGATGALLGVAVRAGRGVLGVTIGTAAGYGAGKLYKKSIGSALNEGLRHAKRLQDTYSLRQQEAMYAWGNASARARQQRTSEMLGAFLGGGLAAAGSGAAVNSWFAESPAVQQAAENIESIEQAEKGTQAPTEAPAAEPVPKAPVPEQVAEVPPPAAEAAETSMPREPVIDEPGEGANSMFWELRKQIEHQSETQRSELAQHIFTDMTPEQWSQTLGFFKIENGEVISRIMHEGDRLFMSPQGELVFHDNFVNPPKGEDVVLMNARGEIQPGAIERIQAGIPAAPAAPTATQGAVVASAEMSSAVPSAVPEQVGAVAPLESVVAAPVAGANQGLSIEDTLSGSEPAYVPTEPKLPGGELSIDDVIGASGTTPSIVPEASPYGASEPLIVDNVINNQISINGFGVEINPNEPARYSWRLPGSNAEYQVIHGGTPEAESALAREYVANHPSSTVFFTDVRYNEFGQPIEYMRAWTSSASGKVEITNNPLNPVTMQELLPVAQPNDFVRKLNQ